MRSNPWRLVVVLSVCGWSLLVACADRETGGTATDEDKGAPTQAPSAQAVERVPEPVAVEEKPAAAPADILLEDVGFAAPDSVLHDVEHDVYLVSNVSGSPIARDDDGFIARVDPDGTVAELKWIDGATKAVELDAPKGMAIASGVLFVADVTTVRKFDSATGEPRGQIDIEGATFLDDVAVGPDGGVYVSDTGVAPSAKGWVATGTDAIYRLTEDGAEAIARGSELGQPKGIAVDDRGVWAVTFGGDELYRIVDGKRVDVQPMGKGKLDALVKLPDGRFLVSSGEGEQIVRGDPGKPFELVLAKVPALGDVGFDAKRDRLLVPRSEGDSVHIIGLR